MEERFLKVSELAERYGLTKNAIFKMVRRGAFPAGVLFGGARRWPLSQLTEWENSKRSK